VRVQQRLHGASPLRGAGGECGRDKSLHECFLGFPVGRSAV
jgi:hypothetical protein